MWKNILCRLTWYKWCNPVDDDAQRLFEKTQLVLYRATTLKHLQVGNKLIQEYKQLIAKSDRPLDMVTHYNELIHLWNTKFKLWKRG